jgi:hypothetical protein
LPQPYYYYQQQQQYQQQLQQYQQQQMQQQQMQQQQQQQQPVLQPAVATAPLLEQISAQPQNELTLDEILTQFAQNSLHTQEEIISQDASPTEPSMST